MLDLEFVQSSNLAKNLYSDQGPGNPHSITETRPVAPRGAAGQKRDARDRVWLFALTDETADTESLARLAALFRSAPAQEPVGVTLGNLMQQARQLAADNQALVACAVCFDRAIVAHRGSACCYLIRHHHATRLTLGNVELVDYQVQPGDILLLSDGPLDRDLKGSEMAAIARQGGDLSAAMQQVLALANQRGTDSRFSAIMVRVRGVEKISHARGRAHAFR